MCDHLASLSSISLTFRKLILLAIELLKRDRLQKSVKLERERERERESQQERGTQGESGRKLNKEINQILNNNNNNNNNV